MKRWMAVLLTGCLTLQAWMGNVTPVYGAETADAAERALSNVADGVLEVEVRSSALFPYEGKVTVRIDGNDGKVGMSRELEFESSALASARFQAPKGEYKVTVSADKFADYTQSVSVEEDWVSKIQVSPAMVETGSEAAAGWIRCGDVNGDGFIDEKDRDVILAAIRRNPQRTDTDLNGDGQTDIVDLQYFVQSLDENRESSVVKLGLLKKTQEAAGTIVEGNVDDFMKNAGSISLAPSDKNAKISPDNPVGLEFVLADEEDASVPLIQGVTIQTAGEADEDGIVSGEITDGEAIVVCANEDGSEQETVFSLTKSRTPKIKAKGIKGAAAQSENAAASVSVDADGSLILDFGRQIAVKRVTIKITGTKKEEPLVNIAKVEFVNNMEERIPAPQLDIPVLNVPVSENEGLTVSWSAQRNVTGYEVSISGPVRNQTEDETQIVRVSGTQHRISSVNDKPLKNYGKYTIKVRSVNGDWASPWSNEQIGEPKPQKAPAAPDNVRAEGGYRSIYVSWKDMSDSCGYMVYYKKSQEDDSSYRPVVDGFTPVLDGKGRLDGTRYTITGLEDDTQYSVYVISWNDFGWGKASLVSVAATKSAMPPALPNYKRINTSNGEGKVTAHIADASFGGSGGAKMVESPLDTTANSAFGLVDENYASYWVKADWDDGVKYPALSKGVMVTLDNEYQMSYLTFAAADEKSRVGLVRVGYWNQEGKGTEQFVNARLLARTDENSNPYYIVKFDRAITASKIHLCLGRGWADSSDMMIGEIHFHYHDSLEEEIMGLYQDEMHTTLRPDVTEQTIRALEERLETVDESSKEKHPLYRELKLELTTAREILGSKLAPSVVVDSRITAQKDGHLGFGGLNAWQPLGKVAYTGESLLVYVGHNTKRTGDATNLQLVITQYHAESNSLVRTVNLKVGRNEITVPQLTSNDFERGGQLYVAYTGNDPSDKYAVRLSGGSDIPVLSVYGKSADERTEAIKTYIGELEAYVGTIQALHEKQHVGTKHVDYAYNQTNCILNATDIMMKDMMYSVPATQVWAGLSGAEDKAAKLDSALRAMEDTMTLFYQHKGLSDEAGTARGNNALPSQHLNIRYMRMFAGAFMYAAGNHIGIEWGSTTLASAPGSWDGFGWGVAHEIGHNINQGTYAIAEITNNYFAQLLTIATRGTRFSYTNVYNKVTSGAIGRSSNVATQLALYWQLHLAFDNYTDDRHIFDNYEEQFENLFFARVDTYSRNPAKAPQAGLTLNGGVDQNLMRLSCAAANKNILPFFERWGMVPDEATVAYAAKYGEPDAKALYYVNDDARDYRAAHSDEAGTIKDRDHVVTASATARSNQVEVQISTDQDEELILGYEISRSMISNGQKKTEIAGFIPIDTADSTVFVDTITSINNRVMEYEVRAVDKFLNYSKAVSAGHAKIQTDGVLAKDTWTVETTMTSTFDTVIAPDTEDPDNGYDAANPGSVQEKKAHSIDRVLDNDRTEEGTYHGHSDGTESVTIDMHKTQEVTALKYFGDALAEVNIEVSEDGSTWIPVKTAYKGLTGESETIVWFDSVKEDTRDNWIGTYDARYVRLTIAQAGDISIREIELCGPSGDNLEFMSTGDGLPAIGVLKEDYKYGDQEADVILKGSLVFTGTYKGNPAYNVVVLYDTDGNVIGAKDGNVQAGQVIFADVPKQGNLGETSDGTWVYYIEPGQWDEDSLKNISGVRGELYRVDDALTLEGERIVSDTLETGIPAVLPEITLTGSAFDR